MNSQNLPPETSEEEAREMEDNSGGGGDGGSCVSQPPSGDVPGLLPTLFSSRVGCWDSGGLEEASQAFQC